MSVSAANATAEKLYEECRGKSGYKSIYQLVIKRAVDIVAGILVSPAVLLITLPVAVAIKAEDGGPVFYVSHRLGKNGREFGMLKFRSMKVNAPDLRNEDGSTYNSEQDPRVTKVGHFLRKTSLDEIPQIFNILLGNMSIIGPRPGDVESKDTYAEDEKDKMLVRPGLTGYSQAYFRNAAGVREKRLYDAYYAHNVKFSLDMTIFFRTVRTVLKAENIYTNQ